MSFSKQFEILAACQENANSQREAAINSATIRITLYKGKLKGARGVENDKFLTLKAIETENKRLYQKYREVRGAVEEQNVNSPEATIAAKGIREILDLGADINALEAQKEKAVTLGLLPQWEEMRAAAQKKLKYWVENQEYAQKAWHQNVNSKTKELLGKEFLDKLAEIRAREKLARKEWNMAKGEVKLLIQRLKDSQNRLANIMKS